MKTITGPSPITHITAFNGFSYKIPERELFALARLDKRAREALIKRHLGLVHLVAKKYWGMPYEDLVQEGCIGLLVAIDRFDPERGYRFSTYANFWIRQSISRALQKNFGQIYLPSHVYFDKIRLERAIACLRACYELGRKSHRNADSTVGLVPTRSLFPAFLSRF